MFLSPLFVTTLCTLLCTVNAQCGARRTRCNGSVPGYQFYPCCQTGLFCAPGDQNGGYCEYLPNYTAPPTVPIFVSANDGCGVLGTRCNGSVCGFTFYACCQTGLYCAPYDQYGGSCQTNSTPPSPPMTSPTVVCRVATVSPTNTGTTYGLSLFLCITMLIALATF